MISIMALFSVGALLSFITAWLLLVSPMIRFFTDRPGARKVHQKITPRIGGISIVISLILLLFLWNYTPFMNLPNIGSQLLMAVIIGTIGITFIGLLDDIVLFSISSPAKFLIEVVIAVLMISISGIKLDTFYFASQEYSTGIFAWPLTVLWLVGVTNALNLIDGVDGLAGMVSLVSFCTIGILANLSGDHGIVIFCTLFAGLIFGFLAHNISPARVFLGDTGSLFLGMVIALLCVYLVSSENHYYPVVVAPLIVGFPLVDVTLAMARRFLKTITTGESIFRGILKTMDADNDHIHHRLMFRGLRHSQTTIVITIYAITTCAVAVVIGIAQAISTLIFLIYLALITAWFTYKLGFFDDIQEKYFIRNNGSQKSQSNSKSPKKVLVLNANEFMRHALESYKQNIFSLCFSKTDDIIDDSSLFSAILFNNTHFDNQPEELSRAIYLAARFQVPIVMIADEFAVSSWERTNRLGIKILFVHKPIYVPKLFNDLYLFTANHDSVRALSSVFPNETSVSALVERKQ